MEQRKPNILFYRITQLVSWLFSRLIFRCKYLRNEIRHAKGPFVVIANHQAAYDFVNLFCARWKPMNFVISNSFYSSLPLKGFMDRLGVIPKQQFQTTVKDLKRIKVCIDAGRSVVIYPAGLMCEDGLSTPIPAATYKLLKWLDVDVYMARTAGTYFVMPKWTSGFRPGKTTMDIYKLFSKEELHSLSKEELREQTNAVLQFDAYREQEQLQVAYANGQNISGLEHVLYKCPNCGREFTIQVRDKHTLFCTNCGFAQQSDKLGFLHKVSETGTQLRYVSDWSRYIYNTTKEAVQAGADMTLSCQTAFHMIDPKKDRFMEVGSGTITLSDKGFVLEGTIHGEPVQLQISMGSFASLPFSPGKYIEVQHGMDIYRCVLEDGRLAMKFINLVKIFYELALQKEKTPVNC